MMIKEKIAGLPRLYETENQDPIVRLRLYDPHSGWSWYPIEYDGNDTMFCYVEGFANELGYVSVNELQESAGKRLIAYKLGKKLSVLRQQKAEPIMNWLI